VITNIPAATTSPTPAPAPVSSTGASSIPAGFVFTKYHEAELLLALKRALELYAHQKKWHALVEDIMRLNFSWKESARKYVELYEKARHL